MNVVVTTEGHFHRTPDGDVWSAGPMVYAFWERYLGQFSEVEVVARVQDIDHAGSGFRRADGDRVRFLGLPDYVGPVGYAVNRREIQEVAREAANRPAAILLRVGCSQTAAAVERAARSMGKPFGVEVITDPYEVFAPGAVRHPLRPYFRQKFMRDLQRQCREAAALAYVTERSLQQRYPANHQGFATHFSDVLVDDSAYAEHARQVVHPLTSAHIVSVGSMAQAYKGFDVLIDAIHLCVLAGLDLTLTLVGDGRHRRELEVQVDNLGLTDRVTFTGQLPSGDSVRAQLDAADIFVLASRTEGLPRVVIEAMARGLPCIGTDVGGIPELLASRDLVPSESSRALAERIQQFCANPIRLSTAAERNLLRSHDFEEASLAKKRTEFLEELRERTRSWYSHAGLHREESTGVGFRLREHLQAMVSTARGVQWR